MKTINKLNKIKKGMFHMNTSPYPELYVMDYPEDATTLAYLDNMWHYHTGCDNDSSMMPQVMLDAIRTKMERTRQTLRELRNGSRHNTEYLTYPVC